MTSSAAEENRMIGYAKKQKATAYNTMTFAKWNELVQKSKKIEAPKKSVRHS